MSEQKTQPEDELDWVSKTQRKQESDAIQKLGRELTTISEQVLAQLPIDDTLLEAIELAKRIRNKREGYRRQLQYIGKLMRQRDCDEIIKGLAKVEAQKQQANQEFHQLETTRDAIIAEGDSAIQAVIDEYPQADRQRLRQLSRSAQREQKQSKPPKSARELFKYLREISEAAE
ncbi:ribosome-associated protein [Neiella marina]|uniref:Dual-action ribosomal maturation protein DarP n=1 Tax=Neiella holothuriorum TaxID=2870530 RepID=A0ABS7EAT9_9GAMM|nr:ribosome biogenesis factor YjgA [Neiella holothuriorum]MBW8189459.1 ribosome-associated protein [Neiella holothuriorum]